MTNKTKFHTTFIIMLFPLILMCILAFFPKVYPLNIFFFIFGFISLGLAIRLYYLDKIIMKENKND